MKTLNQPNLQPSRIHRPSAAAAVLACAALAISSSGCGPAAFVVTPTQTQQQAPGSFSVAPKVDILLVQDDTGSSRPIFTSISSQLAQFLTSIQTQGWDYHLATIPLTTPRTIQQVQASQFDPNWGSQFIPSPFPVPIPRRSKPSRHPPFVSPPITRTS